MKSKLDNATERILLRLALGIIAVFSLTCCDSKDDPEQPMPYGNWLCTEISTDGGSSWRQWPYETTYLNFMTSGMFVTQGYFGFSSGSWSVDKGSVLNCRLDDGTQLRFRTIRCTDTSLELHATTIFGSFRLRAAHPQP